MTNDKLKSIFANGMEIRHIMTSKSGFPIFDLMEKKSDLPTGYIGTSGYAWYTENETELAIFLKLLNTDTAQKDYHQQIQNFLINNKRNIYKTTDIYNKYGEMNNSEQLAFNNLKNPETAKRTLISGYLGAFHIIENNNVLIFHGDQKILKHVNNKDMSINEDYIEINDVIKKLYEKNEIKPEATFSNTVATKLINNIYQAAGISNDLINSDNLQFINDIKSYLLDISGNGWKLEVNSDGNNTQTVIVQFDGAKDKISIKKDKENFLISSILDVGETTTHSIYGVYNTLGKVYIKTKTNNFKLKHRNKSTI